MLSETLPVNPSETKWPVSCVRFGTFEPEASSRILTTGRLSLSLNDGLLRDIRWDGVEVVRAIDCPVRDGNWLTCALATSEEIVTETPDGFSVILKRLAPGGVMSSEMRIDGHSSGRLSVSVRLVPHEDFATNRAGFTVLHPLAGVAGEPLTVTHPNQQTTTTAFPRLISPGQVAFDIAELQYAVFGVGVSIRFEGDVFEMEDQRNWCDASFKTYCRPLALPAPYVLRAEQPVEQQVVISFAGSRHSPKTNIVRGNGKSIRLDDSAERVPQIGLALDAASLPDESDTDALKALNVQFVGARIENNSSAVLQSVHQIASPAKVGLEIVLDEQTDAHAELLRQAAQAQGLGPVAVTALPRAYLKSYQPDGTWPDGARPSDVVDLARDVFPGSAIGAGVFTNFTEFNRCRPGADDGDFITYACCALVHASDDRSVVQCLEGFSHVLESGRAIAGEREFRLGLVSIGMRSNPYGPAVAENAAQVRTVMAGADPRQRGLFGAAWLVGAVAATVGHDVTSLLAGTPSGALGVLYRPSAWPQPIFDDLSTARVYPIFHAVRFLAQLGGKERLSITGLPQDIVGVGARTSSGIGLVLANLSDRHHAVDLPWELNAHVLDARTFEDAIKDPNWLDSKPARVGSSIALAPYDVAFLEMVP